MRCNVIRQAADWDEEIARLENCFLMAPINWQPGPGLVAHLCWNDEGHIGGGWNHAIDLLLPALHITDSDDITIIGFFRGTAQGDLYRKERWLVTPLKINEGFEA